MAQTLLQVEDLSIHFNTPDGEIKAVDGIDFSVEKGESLGLVGESGSGKTVTAMTVMRLIDFEPGQKALKGKIWFHTGGGQKIDLLSLTDSEIRKYRGNRIGMIFQEPMQALNPVMRCGRQVEEAVEAHDKLSGKAAKERVLELFSKVQIRDPERIYQSYPFQISGGQKQRVLIASAIAGKPDLLIADEPTTALDVHVQKAILDLLDQLRKEMGMSLLFISHDLGVISRISDRVLVMRNGKILESGPVRQIFNQPQHPYTRGLLACQPDIKEDLVRLPVLNDFKADEFGQYPDVSSVRARLRSRTPDPSLGGANEILQVKDCQVHFKGPSRGFFNRKQSTVKAVDGVDLSVYQGETLGLVGASGSGKTTLGRAIIKLQPLSNGSIRYKGQDITQMPDREWRKYQPSLQMIFQDPFASLNPRIPVGESIREPLEVHGIVQGKKKQLERVMELLDLVGMDPEHYKRYPHAFSGGQRQRLCIARALTLKPDFLICDECVSSLDVSIQAQVLNLLKDLQEQLGFACIFISHDLAVVKFMADRLLVMDDGKIVEQGRAEEVYRNPKSEITRRLIEAVSF